MPDTVFNDLEWSLMQISRSRHFQCQITRQRYRIEL